MRYCGVVCGQFRFFSVHMARIALSRVKALLRARPGNTIPSISPMCAQVRRRCMTCANGLALTKMPGAAYKHGSRKGP